MATQNSGDDPKDAAEVQGAGGGNIDLCHQGEHHGVAADDEEQLDAKLAIPSTIAAQLGKKLDRHIRNGPATTSRIARPRSRSRD